MTKESNYQIRSRELGGFCVYRPCGGVLCSCEREQDAKVVAAAVNAAPVAGLTEDERRAVEFFRDQAIASAGVGDFDPDDIPQAVHEHCELVADHSETISNLLARTAPEPTHGSGWLAELSREIGEWSDATFGDSWSDGDKAGLPSLHHLREEVEELIASPQDHEEWADCWMLLIDATRRRGLWLSTIRNAVRAKLEVNKQRKWSQPDEHGVCHHVATDSPSEGTP